MAAKKTSKIEPRRARYPAKIMAIMAGASDPVRTRRRLELMLPKLEAAGVPIPAAASEWLAAHPAPPDTEAEEG